MRSGWLGSLLLGIVDEEEVVAAGEGGAGGG